MSHKLVRGAALGRGILIILLGLSVCMDGCARMKARRSARREARAQQRITERIVVDGVTDEWPETAAAVADANYLYFRIGVESESNLQASPQPLTLFIDVDASPATGHVLAAPRAASGYGFDLAIDFSPAPAGRGVAASSLDVSGARTPVSVEAIGLTSAPTFAASAFEVRVSRHADPSGAPTLVGPLADAGSAASMIAMYDAAGQLVGWSDPEVFTKPRASGGRRRDAALPAKPEGTVRILSWNVHRSAPLTNSDPFARVFQAVEPDIILAQEWDQADEATLVSWFTAAVSGQYAWQARTADGPGVAIIAPYPITAVGPSRLVTEESGGDPAQPVRWVAGLVQTPIGNLAVASVHLKCCGSMGSPEDLTRMAQAKVINAAMKTACGENGSPLRVVGGDLNLVGSLPPLHALIAGLDTDASDMEVADAFVLGDSSQNTWADAGTEFPPGRLDYALVSGSTLDVVNAFVLDTTGLSDAALARLGLDRTDSAASDHRPVIIDVRAR